MELKFDRRFFLSNAAIEGTIFGSLLMLIAVSAVPTGAVEQQWDAVFEVAILLLGVCWIVSTTLSRRWHVHVVVAPIAGLVLLACIQTLPILHVSVDPFETRRFVVKAVAVGLTLAMLLYYTSSQKRLLALVHLVVLVGAASAGLGLLLKLAPYGFPSLWYKNLGPESFGQFPNRNHFALLMEMSLGPTLGLAVFTSGRALMLLYAAIALLLCAALILTTSRGGIISMLGQFAFFCWTSFDSSRHSSLSLNAYGQNRFWHVGETLARRFVVTVLFLVVASWGVLWMGGEPVRRRFERIPRELIPSSWAHPSPGRLEIWATTEKLIGAHPVLGSGLGAYRTAIGLYFPAYSVPPKQAHNEYLELMAGGGIVGAALGVWFVLIIVRAARKRLKESDILRRSICLGALVGLVGVAIHSLVDFGLHVTVNALICCSLIAIVTVKVPLGKHGRLVITN